MIAKNITSSSLAESTTCQVTTRFAWQRYANADGIQGRIEEGAMYSLYHGFCHDVAVLSNKSSEVGIRFRPV